MSNRDRIAQAAAEAEAARKEKQQEKQQGKEQGKEKGKEKDAAGEPKRAPKRTTGTKAKREAHAGTRIVWAVCDQTGSTVEVFAYPQETAARAEAKKRTEATGKTHFVKRAEVP